MRQLVAIPIAMVERALRRKAVVSALRAVRAQQGPWAGSQDACRNAEAGRYGADGERAPSDS